MLRVTSLLGILAIGTIPATALENSASTSLSANDTAAALTAYLAQRDAWSKPGSTTETETSAALAAYLAQREQRSNPATATDTSAALAIYLAQRDTWNGSVRRDRALSDYLAHRASWATEAALDRHLAQRDSWNGSVSQDRALTAYLAQRASWGKKPKATAPATTASTNADPKKIERALKAHLAQRATWAKNQQVANSKPARALSEASIQRALKTYLAQRGDWARNAKSARIEIALETYLAQRDRWTKARDASVTASVSKALTAYLARRDRWNAQAAKSSTTAVALNPAEFCAHRVGNRGAIRFPAAARLTSDATPTLAELAYSAKVCPDLKVEIIGHTDATGPASANAKLSLSRAKAIAGYLIKAGVNARSLVTTGAGSDQPWSGSIADRRAEFVITSTATSPTATVHAIASR